MAEYFPEEIKNPRSIAKIVVLISIVALFVGNYMKNRFFSVSGTINLGNQQIFLYKYEIFVALFVFVFLMLFFVLYFAGFHFSKSDVIFIITITSAIVWLALNSYIFPRLTPRGTTGSYQSDKLITQDSVSTIITTDENGITVTVTTEIPKNTAFASSSGLPVTAIIMIALAIIAFSIIVLIVFSRLQNSNFSINLYDAQKYSMPSGERQKSIIEIYIKASQELETQFSKAPDWYSPTFFAEKYGEKTSKLLASYLNILTNLYEKARFSPEVIDDNDVTTAEDIAQQITTTLQEAKEEQ